MNEMEKRMKREQKESKIRTLINKLSAPSSDIGDWKVIKIYEARLQGIGDPYDYDDLSVARQKVRDEINELQSHLEE